MNGFIDSGLGKGRSRRPIPVTPKPFKRFNFFGAEGGPQIREDDPRLQPQTEANSFGGAKTDSDFLEGRIRQSQVVPDKGRPTVDTAVIPPRRGEITQPTGGFNDGSKVEGTPETSGGGRNFNFIEHEANLGKKRMANYTTIRPNMHDMEAKGPQHQQQGNFLKPVTNDEMLGNKPTIRMGNQGQIGSFGGQFTDELAKFRDSSKIGAQQENDKRRNDLRGFMEQKRLNAERGGDSNKQILDQNQGRKASLVREDVHTMDRDGKRGEEDTPQHLDPNSQAFRDIRKKQSQGLGFGFQR